jgi:hypothetical protein
MRSRKFLCAVLAAATLFVLVPAATASFHACDSFGQDWQITLGTFGGTFPGTAVVSGCRDCNDSLGCGGFLPLDGTVTSTAGHNKIWSVTAYNPVGGACYSTHWSGVQPSGTQTVSGTVSNDAGPFGGMTMTLHSNCGGDAARAPVDPSAGTKGTWLPPE